MSDERQQANGSIDGNAAASNVPVRQPSFLEEVAKFAGDMGETTTRTASQTGKVMVDTAVGVGEAIVYSTAQTGKAAVDTAAGIGDAVGKTAFQTGKTMVETAAGIGEVTAKQILQAIEQATQKAGETISIFTDNWLVRKTSGFLKLDWLFGATDSVDLEQAAAAVRKLQQEYPKESPSQIAHRIMVEKATYAGGIGFASSLLPGIAVALLAIDLAATTRLQAEMVYQIAAAYGLDLKDSTRKGEVLAIFGLALGGGRAIRAGLGLLRNVPLAGAVIGASSNAAILYSLGYAACRFYEAKLRSSTETTLEDLKEESDEYLEIAIAQQKLMDKILVHAILASYPDKTRTDILQELESLQLSPVSLKTVTENIKSPQPLEALVTQLNRDYAIPLLAQCYRIARLDGAVTPAETQVMEKIAAKFNLELNSIKDLVESK